MAPAVRYGQKFASDGKNWSDMASAVKYGQNKK
jgi:hypothetical protein